MPEIPWSVAQSLLLTLLLPSLGVAAGILGSACLLGPLLKLPAEPTRSLAAVFALLGGLAAGNLGRELVPFWNLETGWYSLLPATFLAVTGALSIELLLVPRVPSIVGRILKTCLLATCSFWLAGMELFTKQPGTAVGFVLAIYGATWGLSIASQSRHGKLVAGFTALVWGGSSAMLLILAHSARFADLAVLMSCSLGGIGLVAAMTGLRLTPLLVGPAVYFPALMLAAVENTYSEVPFASFALVATAPACLVLVYWGNPQQGWRSSGWSALGVACVPCLLAILLAVRAEVLSH